MGTTYASQVIDERTAKPRGSFWRELPLLLGVAILVAVLVRAFVLQTFYIPSESMEHTLNINDRVLVNKVVYDFRAPHRGGIMGFKSPTPWRSDPAAPGRGLISETGYLPGAAPIASAAPSSPGSGSTAGRSRSHICSTTPTA